MNQDSVVGVFQNVSGAKQAVAKLKAEKYATDNVSLVASNLEDAEEVHGFAIRGDRSEKDALLGGGVGGVLGLLAGAAFFWIPGIGPIILAGPLATALVGTAVGSLVGAMSGWGVPDDQLELYEQLIRDGQVLVIAHGNSAEVAQARDILNSTAATQVDVHFKSSDESPEIDDRPTF